MINVAIVEDNITIREGLAVLIGGTANYQCIGAFSNCESFISKLGKLNVDVILLDIQLPGISGIKGIKYIRNIVPDVNIIMLTVYEDRSKVFEALCAGACGYLLKSTPPQKILDSIEEANSGGSPMSSNIARKVISLFSKEYSSLSKNIPDKLLKRETAILTLLSEGNNYKEIAERLSLSIDTIRHYIRLIYKKLHVHTQSAAVAKALKKGLIS
ncbi:MAG: response regulator transcription factor [Melioribacteraceae bacterium]|nr:response regulator transcription factor [Melioribacteraceae bacterium]